MRATHPPDTQECERIWTHEWKDAFQKIKDHQLLKYFSESGPAEGQGGASKDGFGFLILQYGQPVTSTSGALPVVERKYTQIEKEFLAAFIGKEPNYQYVSSKKVILRTAFVATSAVWLQDTLQAWEKYDYQHSRAYTEDCERSPAEVEVNCIYANYFLSGSHH